MARKKRISLNSRSRMTQEFLDQFGAAAPSIKELIEDPSTPRGLDMKSMKLDLPKPLLVEFSNYYDATPEKIAGSIGIMDRLYYVLDYENLRTEKSPKQYYLRVVAMRLRINNLRAKVLGWQDHYNWWSINPAKPGADHVDTLGQPKKVKPVTTLPDCLAHPIKINDYVFYDYKSGMEIGQIIGFTQKSLEVQIQPLWTSGMGDLSEGIAVNKNQKPIRKWCNKVLIIHDGLEAKMLEIKLLSSK